MLSYIKRRENDSHHSKEKGSKRSRNRGWNRGRRDKKERYGDRKGKVGREPRKRGRGKKE